MTDDDIKRLREIGEYFRTRTRTCDFRETREEEILRLVIAAADEVERLHGENAALHADNVQAHNADSPTRTENRLMRAEVERLAAERDEARRIARELYGNTGAAVLFPPDWLVKP